MSSRSRGKEIESNLFLKGLLRKISKEGRSVFLLAASEAKLDSLRDSLINFYGPLNIVAAASKDGTAGEDDSIVNEVNSSLPDIIIMNLESPDAERFIKENRMKLNTQLIVILRDVSFRVNSRGEVKKGGLGDFLMRRVFKNAAVNYVKEDKAEEAEEKPDVKALIESGKIVELGKVGGIGKSETKDL